MERKSITSSDVAEPKRAKLSKKVRSNPVLFDVVEKPVFVDGIEVPGRKAIVRGDTNQVLSIMTDDYVPVSNLKVLEDFATIAEDAGIKWELGDTHTLRNGSLSIMEVHFPNNMINLDKKVVGQEIMTTAYLRNGFDGFNMARLSMGAKVLVCTNGMVVGHNDFDIGYRHVGAVNSKLVDKFKEYFVERMVSAQKLLNDMTQLKFKNTEAAHEAILGSAWMGKTYQKALLEEWEKVSRSREAWIVYNVFTYVITHVIKANIEGKLALMRRLNKATSEWFPAAKAVL